MDNIEDRAKAMLDTRMRLVRALVAADQQVTDRETALAAAVTAKRDAYRDAVRNGWSTTELRELGFSEPGSAAAARPRRTRKGSARRSPEHTPSVSAPTAEGSAEVVGPASDSV